jgi:hypothetical protein
MATPHSVKCPLCFPLDKRCVSINVEYVLAIIEKKHNWKCVSCTLYVLGIVEKTWLEMCVVCFIFVRYHNKKNLIANVCDVLYMC